jgi:hypothetical protein
MPTTSSPGSATEASVQLSKAKQLKKITDEETTIGAACEKRAMPFIEAAQSSKSKSPPVLQSDSTRHPGGPLLLG